MEGERKFNQLKQAKEDAVSEAASFEGEELSVAPGEIGHEVSADKAGSFYNKLESAHDEKQKERLRVTIAIVEAVQEAGGRALVVGGYVRDEVLARLGQEIRSKDIDIEVYGLEFERLRDILQTFGEVGVVGASFQVIKMGDIDISIPRRDSKTGLGHKDFIVTGDPSMSVAEAARRRDFTMNALAMDPLTGEIIDEYGGVEDIKSKTLRATDKELFGDDPLRVLRAMQFSGRFGFSIDKETLELCRRLELRSLSRERIGEEWAKLLLLSKKPSIGLEAARQLGILDQLHPEIRALIDVPQEEAWHPEGDVWTHTKMAIDAAAEIVRRENLDKEEAAVVMYGALCHDLGKPITTAKDSRGRIISHGHADAGVEPAKSFFYAVNVPQKVSDKVTRIIKDHLFPALNEQPTDAAVRRLAARLSPATIQEFLWVAEADHRGRDIEWDGFPPAETLLSRATELKIGMSAPEPILMGRHLLELGMKPGPNFGKILRAVYDAQLSGDVTTIEEAKNSAQKFSI